METKKQTALEWLKEMLIDNKYLSKDAEHLFEEAKSMEKQQMKDAVLAQSTKHEGLRKIFDKQFEQYYNETYGKA